MAKPNKTFKMSKTTKRMMALMGGPAEGRNQFKRMMIDAQVCSEIVVKSSPRDNKRPQGTAYVTNDTGTASTQV
jgi:hypothetical protein